MQPSSSTSPETDIRLRALREIFLRLMERPGAKTDKLKDAFIETMEIGLWRPGETIPTEKQLKAALPVSQGTIQAALRLLTADGIIERRRGSGSRISSSLERGKEAWFMRFRHPGDPALQEVRILSAEMRETSGSGPWSTALGPRPAYIRLDRRLDVGGLFVVVAVSWLDAGRFRPLLDYSREIIAYTHLRHLLHDRFNAPTLRTRESARLRDAAPEIAAELAVAEGTPVLTLETTNLSLHGEPIVYQEFHIPPNGLTLDLSRR